MTDFWRRLYAAITFTGPGYDPAATREAELRATLAELAERWEQTADRMTANHPTEFYTAVTETELVEETRASVLRTSASDVRDVLRTGLIPHPIMTDAELEQHGASEENAS